jgi:hypothetical protein
MTVSGSGRGRDASSAPARRGGAGTGRSRAGPSHGLLGMVPWHTTDGDAAATPESDRGSARGQAIRAVDARGRSRRCTGPLAAVWLKWETCKFILDKIAIAVVSLAALYRIGRSTGDRREPTKFTERGLSVRGAGLPPAWRGRERELYVKFLIVIVVVSHGRKDRFRGGAGRRAQRRCSRARHPLNPRSVFA